MGAKFEKMLYWKGFLSFNHMTAYHVACLRADILGDRRLFLSCFLTMANCTSHKPVLGCAKPGQLKHCIQNGSSSTVASLYSY